jgi:hypothetical protein
VMDCSMDTYPVLIMRWIVIRRPLLLDYDIPNVGSSPSLHRAVLANQYGVQC